MGIAGRALPTTFEYIEANAIREPGRLALVQDNQSWTYGALYADLRRVVRLLHDMGVRPGQRVAVGALAFQTSMLLLIGAESLGAVTTYFLPEGDPDVEPLFRIVDWVISDHSQLVPANARFVPVNEDFVRRFNSAQSGDSTGLPLVAPALHQPQRIARTSGSSGLSKFMVLSRQAQEYWITSAIATFVLRADSRLLIQGALVMNGMYSRASACLRLGAVAIAVTESAVAAHSLTHIASMPVYLRPLLDALPAGYKAARPVDTFVVGGFLSAGMRNRIARVFGGRIVNRYGTNETGAICDDIDATGVGVVSAGVDIRVIDAEGEEVPMGELGIITVRTPSMVDGYVGEPQASAAAFAQGWFRTGDWGALTGPRMLHLAGRHDDIINVGGLKYAANEIERQLRERVKPLDCAVLAKNLQGGLATVGVALVVEEGTNREHVVRSVSQFMEHTARVLFVDSIPVLPSGKVDRLALHRLFASQPTEDAQ